MAKANMDIRELAEKRGVRIWEIAHGYGVNDITMSRKLRFELPQEQKEKIVKIINQIAESRK